MLIGAKRSPGDYSYRRRNWAWVRVIAHHCFCGCMCQFCKDDYSCIHQEWMLWNGKYRQSISLTMKVVTWIYVSTAIYEVLEVIFMLVGCGPVNQWLNNGMINPKCEKWKDPLCSVSLSYFICIYQNKQYSIWDTLLTYAFHISSFGTIEYFLALSSL